MSDTRTLRGIFSEAKTFAIVGLSADWYRPSYFAAKYLQEQGYRIVPVNPRYETILGERCYPDLLAVPTPIDVVDVFRKPVECPGIARQAVAMGARVLWLQLDVISEEAKSIAETHGLTVVMNRCVKIEYARLFGGLNWFGVNTRIISSQRARCLPRAQGR